MVSYSLHPDARPYRYLKALNERGDRVDVICLRVEGEPYYETYDGGCIFRIQTRRYDERTPFTHLIRLVKFFFLSAYTCTRLHLKYRYDLIHFHNIPDFGVFCTLIPKMMGARIILDIHDIVPEFYVRKFSVGEDHIIIKALKWIEKLSAGYADHVITVTDIWRERLIERSVEPEKCSVILNAPDSSMFNTTLYASSSQNGRFVVGYHGNLNEPTGVDIAIKAIKKAAEKIPSIQFKIVGKGRELKRLKRLVKDLRLKNHVSFYPPVSVEHVPQILTSLDVGVDPKRDGVYAGETLSVKAMEYLAMHVPLIISRTETAQAYFDDSMVMFFKPGDEKDLARCILELYESPHKRDRLVKNADGFNKEYSWEKYKKIYYHLIDNL